MKTLNSEIIIDMDPFPKPRMTRRDKWNPTPSAKRYFSNRAEFKYKCNLAGYKLTPELSVTFVVPMPKSWSKKKKLKFDGRPHQSRPDLDNYVKAFKDSLESEDSFVWNYRNVKKVWGQSGCIIITLCN